MAVASQVCQQTDRSGGSRRVARLPRPKSHYKRSGEIKDGVENHKCTKPDVDNHVKSLFDALNKIAWLDDSQVVKLSAEKRYCDDEHPVGVEIEIKPLAQGA